MSVSDAERELWRQTRKYINDYDDRAAELQLDLRRERSALESAAHRRDSTKQEAEQRKQHTSILTQKCNEQRIDLLALQKESITMSSETERLSHQLQLLQNDVKAKQLLQQQKRDRYANHLKEQQAVVEEYTTYGNLSVKY